MIHLRHFFDLVSKDTATYLTQSEDSMLLSGVGQDLRYPGTNTGSLVRKQDWLVRKEMHRPH